MARRWTFNEEKNYRRELEYWYLKENKAIGDISKILKIASQTVFQRLERLKIKTNSNRKVNYRNRRHDLVLPKSMNVNMAEFFGIMLGDGHISHFQTLVTLGTKELRYVAYVQCLMSNLFNAQAKVSIRANKYRDIYLGSVILVQWLKKHGLVQNKVKAQVDIPDWIIQEKSFNKAFVKGFFDTDGSVYILRHGIQIAFTNFSKPLLKSLQSMLIRLGYNPSKISSNRIYLTNRHDILRFFDDIKPANLKHWRRFKKFVSMRQSYSGNYIGL